MIMMFPSDLHLGMDKTFCHAQGMPADLDHCPSSRFRARRSDSDSRVREEAARSLAAIGKLLS